MRTWHAAILWIALFIVAASTGLELLSYLAYLLLFVGVAMWVQARLTLDGLSVTRALSQTYAHLGDTFELVYELRNTSSFGKLWLEISEESNWPEPLPGRVLSIGGGGKTRKWKVLAKAIRRGRYKLGPIVLRSGDPFGLFPREARVPTVALLLVYPRVVPLPHWRLPGSVLEGGVLTGQRSLQSTSMVMGIREYRSGDAMNRIHWPSSMRHRTLHVKEFELDKTADLWIYLDLERHWHRGEGEDSTEERTVTVAASIVRKALDEHRNVGLITSGARAEVFQPDRGTKQFGKLMQYLAEIRVSGSRTLAETLVETLPRLRRGSACVLITPSLDRAWVRPASTLREASIATQAVIVAAPSQSDERDRARRLQLFGELAIAGVTATYLAPGASISDLFRDAAGAVA
ncbi:MAG TPA: DUF58 domain-containing protein [Candidatus Limnocylindria bacterium]|nr:DUF58 domain-containing protein [Candidatus Limnocylindria bacterium]